MFKFIKCTNPNINHVKMIYGYLVETWNSRKCECGYDFEGLTEVPLDVIDNDPAFQNVNPEDDTKILPYLKLQNKKQSDRNLTV